MNFLFLSAISEISVKKYMKSAKPPQSFEFSKGKFLRGGICGLFTEADCKIGCQAFAGWTNAGNLQNGCLGCWLFERQ
jgi:hypothetical protein